MSGAIPYFLTILVLEAKWMRYMLPLVPIFCLLGAALLMRGYAWSRRRMRTTPYLRNSQRPVVVVQRNLFPILTAFAVGGAFLWAVAFMNIYSQEHSRVQASEWFYDNVPQTLSVNGVERPTRISQESWDDQVPLGIAPHDGKPLA